jgi:WD40 repeat protein
MARVSANIHTRFVSAIFNDRSSEVFATTFLPELSVFASAREGRAVGPHLVEAATLELADNGHTFAAYGSSESVEIWTAQEPARQRVIATGQGTVSRVAFIDKTDDFVTAGRDGRLIYRTAAGDPKRVVTLDHPIVNVLFSRGATNAVINTSDGAIWRADGRGNLLAVHGPGVQVVRMLRFPDTGDVLFAYANGDIVVLDTISWRQSLLLHVTQAVRDIAVSPDGRTIAAVDNDDVVHVGQVIGDTLVSGRIQWTHFPLRAHRIAVSADGLLVATCDDGTIWLFSWRHRNWLCIPTGTADLTNIAISSDNKTATTFDTDGRVIWLDLELARERLTAQDEPTIR